MRRIFPTVVPVTTVGEVRQAEYDVLVTRQNPADVASSLFLLALGATALGRSGAQIDEYRYGNSQIGFYAQSLARELVVGSGLPPRIERAVVEDLLPSALADPGPHSVLAIGTWVGSDVAPVRSLRTFLQTSAGEPLAGSFMRAGYVAETWALPTYADPGRWASVAIEEWRRQSPDRFPRPWFENRQWLTVPEEDVSEALAALPVERQRLLAELDAREAALEAESRLAAERAMAGERRLLVAQGEDLVNAVANVLEEIGFKVQRMDAVFPPGDRREDLRVTAPAQPDWEAIAEVRGYAGGAQLGDLFRLTRFAQRYRDERGREPSACWYICNQFLGGHPSERPPMLASNRDETRAFQENHRLALIDTSSLFRVQKQIRRAERSAHEVRLTLLGLDDRFDP